MQKKFESLASILKALEKENITYRSELKKIENDVNLSGVGKTLKQNALRTPYVAKLNEYQDGIALTIGDLRAAAEQRDSSLDFVSDPDFVNALRLIEIAKAGTPTAIIDNLVGKYSTVPEALKTIAAVLKNSGINDYDGNIANRISSARASHKIQALDDAIYYATSSDAPDFVSLYGELNATARALGCNIDIAAENNPQ